MEILKDIAGRRMGYLLNEAARQAHTRVQDALREFKITPHQLGIMEAIEQTGPTSQRVIADCTKVDRTSMVGVIDALEKLGYVRRQADPEDRRSHQLVLTPRGAKVLEGARAAAQSAEEDFLSGLTEKARRALRETLSSLIKSCSP